MIDSTIQTILSFVVMAIFAVLARQVKPLWLKFLCGIGAAAALYFLVSPFV